MSETDCDKAPRRGAAAAQPIYGRVVLLKCFVLFFIAYIFLRTGHNEDWENNVNRCPMYLTMICHVDDSWPDPDDWGAADGNQDIEEDVDALCLDKFHRVKSLLALRAVFHELGSAAFTSAFNHFSSLRDCGFSVDEILNGDTTLIHRNHE